MCLAFAVLSSSELAAHFSPYDLKRLELYSRSMVDYHLVMDLIPTVARIFFLKQLGDTSLSAAQCVSFPICYGLSCFSAVIVIPVDCPCSFLGITAGYRAAAQISGTARKGNWSPKLAAHGTLQPSDPQICASKSILEVVIIHWKTWYKDRNYCNNFPLFWPLLS